METGRIEVPDAEIHGEIQQPLAHTGLGQPHQAGAAEAKRRGLAGVGQGDGGQHSGAGVGRGCARLKRPAGIACAHHPGRLVARHYGAGTNHGAFADRNAGSQKGFRADPGIGTDRNRPLEQLEVFGFVIVAAGAEMHPLRHHRSLSQAHRSHGVADHTPTEGGVIGHLEIPGSPDLHIVVNEARRANACPEAAQQPAAPGVQGGRRGSEQHQPGDLPG